MKAKSKSKQNEQAPAHLREETRAWWNSVNEDFELDAHHRLLLTSACECLDRIAEARETLKEQGPYFTNRHGEHKVHPAVNVARDNHALFCRILRELQLDDPANDSRPPMLAEYRGR